MKICTAYLKSATPYSQSKQHGIPRQEKEEWQAWEERTWKEKAHVNKDGYIFIPPMAFKQALDATAARLGIKIPGAGNKTYTQSFVGGILIMDELPTGYTPDTCVQDWISAHANGKRGSGTRVPRAFPTVPNWEGSIDINILDDTLTKPVVERVLRESGKFCGIGRFRPQNGGYYGRYTVERVDWREE